MTAKTDDAPVAPVGARNALAASITLVSIAGIVLLGLVIVGTSAESQRSETAKTLMATVLPLFGSWVGTVLAFYFSRENFEAANRSVAALVKQITPDEKLQSTPVSQVLIPKDKLFFKRVPADQIKLVETLEELKKSKKGDRLPILHADDHPVYMIHASKINEYLAEKALSVPPVDLKTLTMQILLDDRADLKTMFENGFVVVKEDANLADAKTAMNSIPDCQDAFVSKSGKKDEPIVGWLTNVIIEENSKV